MTQKEKAYFVPSERVKKIQAKLRQYDRWFTEEYEHPDFQRLYWELL